MEIAGGRVSNAHRNYIIEGSPNYDGQAAGIAWSNILGFFEQELLASRQNLPEDQVGIQFRKLSGQEREYYKDRMERDSKFAKEVASGFSAFWNRQLDEDKEYFLSKAKTNKNIAKGLGGASASNFAKRSESDKKLILDMAKKNEDFAQEFMEHASFAFENKDEEGGRAQLSEIDKKKIFELSSSHPQLTRDFGRGMATNINNMDSNRRNEAFGRVSEGHSRNISESKGQEANEFARGFGEGLPFQFVELGPEDKNKVRKLLRENAPFADGMMNGFKWVYLEKFSEDQRNELWTRWSWIPRFAKGLGVTFGLGFSSIPNEIRARFLDFVKKSPDFAHGFGQGAALIQNRLKEDDLNLVKSLVQSDDNFKTGFLEEVNNSKSNP